MEDNNCPSKINSFHLNKALIPKFLGITKKRKLQAEQLGLPTPKHKCWNHCLPHESLSAFEEKQGVEDIIEQVTGENTEIHVIDDESDHESVKDSNSFVGDSDSMMSVYGEAKSESEISKLWPCDKPSTSAAGGNSFQDMEYSSEDMTAVMVAGKGKLTFRAEECNLHHHYDEFGNHLDYNYTECGNDRIEPCIDKEYDDILHSNGVNHNIYVLSSGKWSVKQDAQAGTRGPTIDQEFEQYFSMLML